MRNHVVALRAGLLFAMDELAALNLPPLLDALAGMVEAYDRVCAIKQSGEEWKVANDEYLNRAADVMAVAKRLRIGGE